MAEIVISVPKLPLPRLPGGRKAKLGIVLGLSGLLAITIAVAGFYLTTRKPITELPMVEQVTRPIPPRRLFSFAEVASPIGVAVSPDGQRIYVAEGGGERLIKAFDRDGRLVGEMAPPNTKPGNRKPSFLATDASGQIYAIDRSRVAIDTYSPAGEWQGAWVPPVVQSLGGWLPNGLTIGTDGRFYIADIGHAEHSILVLGPEGDLLNTVGKSSDVPGGLNYPVQAAADDEGRIYVSDASNGRVLAVSPRGVNAVGTLGEEAVTLPLGVAVGGQKVFVADAAAHRIAVFGVGDRPEYLYSFGDTDDEDGLTYPHAVAVDRTGRVYIADRVNHRVQVWIY